jgi:hypothetical protein
MNKRHSQNVNGNAWEAAHMTKHEGKTYDHVVNTG